MAQFPVVDLAPDPDPPPLEAAAQRLVALALDVDTPQPLTAARELTETLTLDQLGRLQRALRDAEQVVSTTRARMLVDAIRKD